MNMKFSSALTRTTPKSVSRPYGGRCMPVIVSIFLWMSLGTSASDGMARRHPAAAAHSHYCALRRVRHHPSHQTPLSKRSGAVIGRKKLSLGPSHGSLDVERLAIGRNPTPSSDRYWGLIPTYWETLYERPIPSSRMKPLIRGIPSPVRIRVPE